MAKDGDIIDVMFGWIFELIGSGFKALFSKSENANNQQ